MLHEHVTASLFDHWNTEFPLAVTTVYPGVVVDTDPLAEWLELRLDTWNRRPGRKAGKAILDVTVTVHVFVKPSTDQSRQHELVDAARSTLAHAGIPVKDFESSGEPTTGHLELFEPETTNLTRSDGTPPSLHHTLLRLRGFAQEL